jgi:hypothetical protein
MEKLATTCKYKQKDFGTRFPYLIGSRGRKWINMGSKRAALAQNPYFYLSIVWRGNFQNIYAKRLKFTAKCHIFAHHPGIKTAVNNSDNLRSKNDQLMCELLHSCEGTLIQKEHIIRSAPLHLHALFEILCQYTMSAPPMTS